VEILKLFFSTDTLPSPLLDRSVSTGLTGEEVKAAVESILKDTVPGTLLGNVVTAEELEAAIAVIKKQIEELRGAVADLKSGFDGLAVTVHRHDEALKPFHKLESMADSPTVSDLQGGTLHSPSESIESESGIEPPQQQSEEALSPLASSDLARPQKGLTGAELAKELGVDPGSISRWKSGKSRPKAAIAREFEKWVHRGDGLWYEISTEQPTSLDDG
jgi:DNA-binding XRE family transcriptional regulator